MVMDTRRLCAAIFERSGIAVDEHDPIVAVLAASAEQTEEIGERLLSRTSPVRIVVAVTVAAAIFAAAGTVTGWVLAEQRFGVCPIHGRSGPIDAYQLSGLVENEDAVRHGIKS